MNAAIALAAIALTLDAVAFRRAAVAVAAIGAAYVAAVAATAVAASAVAASVVVVVVGVVAAIVDGTGSAPTSPGYLARAVDAPANMHGPIRRARSRVTLAVADVVAAIGGHVDTIGTAANAANAAIRFLEPMWDDTADEIDRLVACYRRAVASRHRSRASHYAARIAALGGAIA